MKTLVVEDDFASRLLLQMFLRRYGECDVAVDGREALDAFGASIRSGTPYDLVCLDIMLPKMDGQGVLKGIRELEENAELSDDYGVKVIMTSALKDTKTVATAFRSLCDAYLVKPIDTAQLLQHIRDFGLVP